VSDWGIYYDPKPTETIIQDDKQLLEIYREVEELQDNVDRTISKWLLRFRMNSDPTTSIFDDDYFQFSRDVVNRIDTTFNCEDPEHPIIQIINSDDTSTNGQVIRIRPYDIGDEDGQDCIMVLRELADQILNKITLRGFDKITKVFYT